MSNNNILCSFCGANQAKVDILIEGESAYICNNCIIKSFNGNFKDDFLGKFVSYCNVKSQSSAAASAPALPVNLMKLRF